MSKKYLNSTGDSEVTDYTPDLTGDMHREAEDSYLGDGEINNLYLFRK